MGSEHTNLRLQQSHSESLILLLAEEICATVPQLLSYSDYLNQIIKPNSYALPVRGISFGPREGSPSTVSSKHSNTSTDESESTASTPQYSPASSPSSTSTHSSYSSNTSAPRGPASRPRLFTPGELDPASTFHLLFKLHNLILIPWLPSTMKSWIHGRISWIESNSDPYSASRLKDMALKRPADGFPVSNAPGQKPHGGICDTIATNPTDQRLWFLAHSWLFVSIDWNSDYYSEPSKGHDHKSDTRAEQLAHAKYPRR